MADVSVRALLLAPLVVTLASCQRDGGAIEVRVPGRGTYKGSV